MQVSLLADSVQPLGVRATTFLLTYPRYIHAEVLTHRVFSRNSASSRAIPVAKTLKSVIFNPVVPIRFGKAKKGMQDAGPLSSTKAFFAKHIWLKTRWAAIAGAYLLDRLGLHKQFTNRLLEPWVEITVVLTGTDFDNFFKLRNHDDAQPEIRQLAIEMQQAMNDSTPTELKEGEWHLPFISQEERHIKPLEQQLVQSVARCARTSYINFYGRDSLSDDLRLFNHLLNNGHWSPFEHQLKAVGNVKRSGNVRGYVQYRKTFIAEGEQV